MMCLIGLNVLLRSQYLGSMSPVQPHPNVLDFLIPRKLQFLFTVIRVAKCRLLRLILQTYVNKADLLSDEGSNDVFHGSSIFFLFTPLHMLVCILYMSVCTYYTC